MPRRASSHDDRETVIANERFQAISDEPLWTEYLYFFASDPAIGKAISVHAGRDLDDRELWRASIVVFLPGDQLLVTMAEGRGVSHFKLQIGALAVECVEPGQLWTLRFDGSAEQVDRATNMRQPHAGGPAVSLTFAIDLPGVAPWWNLKSSIGDAKTYSRMHAQQISAASGSISVAGTTEPFGGMGVRDHSAGPRDYGLVEGDFWISALFPSGRAIMAQVVALADSQTNAGYISTSHDMPLELITVGEHPMVPDRRMPPGSVAADPLDDPAARRFTLEIHTSKGVETLEGELLHAGAVTFLPPASEALGTHGDLADALQWTESVLLISWDGEIGHGVRERIAPMPVLAISGRTA